MKPEHHKLQGQVAVVTGAGRGIGRAVAELLASEGAAVVLAARTAGQIESVREVIELAGGVALAVQADVTIPADVARLTSAARQAYGRIDILVNCAGMAPLGGVLETTPEVLRECFDVNALGTFLCIKAVAQEMMDRGKGKIINISSGSGRRAHADWLAYCTSKFAVMGLSDAISREMRQYGVNVNVVCPGPTATEMRRANFPDEDRGRLQSPRSVARVVLYLASEESDELYGQAIDVRPRDMPI